MMNVMRVIVCKGLNGVSDNCDQWEWCHKFFSCIIGLVFMVNLQTICLVDNNINFHSSLLLYTQEENLNFNRTKSL